MRFREPRSVRECEACGQSRASLDPNTACPECGYLGGRPVGAEQLAWARTVRVIASVSCAATLAWAIYASPSRWDTLAGTAPLLLLALAVFWGWPVRASVRAGEPWSFIRVGCFVGALAGCVAGATLAFPSRFPGGGVAAPKLSLGELLPPAVGALGCVVGALAAGVVWAVKAETQEDAA
jgi:hypothetical protein